MKTKTNQTPLAPGDFRFSTGEVLDSDYVFEITRIGTVRKRDYAGIDIPDSWGLQIQETERGALNLHFTTKKEAGSEYLRFMQWRKEQLGIDAAESMTVVEA